MDKIIKFVCEELKNDFSGHDFDHAKRVYNNALNISNMQFKQKSQNMPLPVNQTFSDCVISVDNANQNKIA